MFFCCIMTCRNQDIFSLLRISVTVMSTQCCQPKNSTAHPQIMASVSRCQHFLGIFKPYKRIISRVLIPSILNTFFSACNFFLQSTKCSSTRELKLLCADDEQTRTCWITAMRLLKVGYLITNDE